ncbi:FAD-binding protein [Diplocloster modestus]|uniref:FAD-binding protein n=1 Tax=Diplocloster modestus TaxID=2850322 RepID=A0ABS6K5V3_9FIRM|nr:FAD-binding protein [Diplocloster modestus]
MQTLHIHEELVNEQTAGQLMTTCPFGAISYENGKLDISAGCKMCKLCVKKGPQGVITLEEQKSGGIDKSLWNGVTVFAEYEQGRIHPVVFELIGKARELAAVNAHPVYAVILGSQLNDAAQELLHYGVDEVFVYDRPELSDFRIGPYANALEDFVKQVHPSAVLVGATNLGRSLAPKVAARFRTGLTADCTILQMKDNTDLVQIRPAFGGNIMAQIVTPNARPQFCTVRYKIFSAPKRQEQAGGKVTRMQLPDSAVETDTEVLQVIEKPKEIDISEAEVIVAAGRGVKSPKDMEMIEELCELLGAHMACTRPLIEAGWFDAKHQIGLSGRTVKPKLIITLGISGSVQFVAGMKGSDCIIAVNQDPNASIFDVAHYGLVGDLYEIVPKLTEQLKGGHGR